MIPAGVQIMIAVEPIDLRSGFNRLSGMAREQFGLDPRSGALFVFFGKRMDATKILFHDGTGPCLFYKRLDSRLFKIPPIGQEGAQFIEISEAFLDAILEGVEKIIKKRKKRILH